MFKPTPMQEKAINARGNVLVAAAAGSGKTAVLTERVIKMLSKKQNPVSADRLLIVTFTNAAAAEMRSRIEKRLFEECRLHPDDVGLLKQKQLISGADICTIDSFCINLVRENFEKCGVSPDFKVGNTGILDTLAQRVMSEITAPLFAEQSDEFKTLLELTSCENDERSLTEAITKVFLYSRQLPFPERFIKRLEKPYYIPFSKGHPWYDNAFEAAREYIGFLKQSIESIVDLSACVSDGADGYIAFAEKASFIVGGIENEISKKDWDSLRALLASVKYPNLPSSKVKGDPAIDSIKAIKASLKKDTDELFEIFSQSVVDIQKDIDFQRGAVSLFCSLVDEYSEKLFDAYNEADNFDFYNTEQLALNLLCTCDENGKISKREENAEICERYDEVLVDEFQDVNDLQNTLFSILSKDDKNLFAVGDMKQSIYGFRGANPKNFLKKKNSYKDIDLCTDENEPKKIILSDNFRSRKGVCEFINYFFKTTQGTLQNGYIYDDSEQLNPAARFKDNGETAVKIVVTDCANVDGDDKLINTEARAIADYIYKTVRAKKAVVHTGDGELKEATYGDFAILVNSIKTSKAPIVEALKARNIPVSAENVPYNETYEIILMLSLLKVIDNPKNDAELISVMMSPMFSFSAEELAQIRNECKSGDIYSAVHTAAKTGNTKAESFLESLLGMRRLAALLPLPELIEKLVLTTDIINFVSAMPNGNIRRNNLISLSKYAQGFGSDCGRSISAFVDYILECDPKKFKADSLPDKNAVSIMTMHSSKGLQFPICILANNSSTFNRNDSISKILFDGENGLTFKYFDERTEAEKDSLGHRIASKQTAMSMPDEKMRLLYVAMTRAEDSLVIFSSANDLEKRIGNIATKVLHGVSPAFIKRTVCMNDWIIAAALRHPDGGAFRKLSCVNIMPVQTESRFEVINGVPSFENAASENQNAEGVADTEIANRIKQNAEYSYPYDELRKIQAKMSVSAVANREENLKFGFSSRPSFMLKGGLTPAERGTAIHKFMQYCDISSKPDLSGEKQRLFEYGFISEKEADSIDISLISHFFESSLFGRILSSPDVRREMKFMTEVPAFKLDSELSESVRNTPVIIQGAVDLCFEEDDGIVVVDFKTDRVQNEDELKNTYKEQLTIYSKACEKIFAKPVKERIIYSFALSKEIRV